MIRSEQKKPSNRKSATDLKIKAKKAGKKKENDPTPTMKRAKGGQGGRMRQDGDLKLASVGEGEEVGLLASCRWIHGNIGVLCGVERRLRVSAHSSHGH